MNFSTFSVSHDHSLDCARIKELFLKDTTTDKKLWNFASMDEVKLIVVKDWKTEINDISKLISIFGTFGQSSFLHKDYLPSRDVAWAPDWKIEARNWKEIRFWKPRCSYRKIFGIFGKKHESEAKNKCYIGSVLSLLHECLQKKSCHHFSNKTLVVHRFEISLRFRRKNSK